MYVNPPYHHNFTMTSRKEFIVNHETSIHLFTNNKIYDFKVKLPIDNHENSNTVISMKKILCRFTRNNIIQQTMPSILRTDYSKVSSHYLLSYINWLSVEDFFEEKQGIDRKDKNIFKSVLGA